MGCGASHAVATDNPNAPVKSPAKTSAEAPPKTETPVKPVKEPEPAPRPEDYTLSMPKRAIVGNQIPMFWTGPRTRSSEQWLGIFLAEAEGVASPRTHTREATQGRWRRADFQPPGEGDTGVQGVVIFAGDLLPTVPGKYICRYMSEANVTLARSEISIEIPNSPIKS